MKSSIHLFYGIIIGILLVACTGSFKEDKAEFKEEKILYLGSHDPYSSTTSEASINKELAEVKQKGYTIIDLEMNRNGNHYVLIGK